MGVYTSYRSTSYRSILAIGVRSTSYGSIILAIAIKL